MGAHETRTFKSGNSEAVRLPKGMGFGIGVDVRVEREPGGRIVLTPVVDRGDQWRAENGAALQSSNVFVEENGLPLAGSRLF